MANTGNTQQNINYGATANDGTGDPLRTAFIKVDENFDNVWLAGPVGSNITITDNTIQNNSTNGNIILKPNGVGVIQANAAIVPSAANVRDIGSNSLPFRAGYFGVGGLRVDGNVTVTGNLTAGNISYTGNVFVGDLQGSVFADDSTIMVDAIDNRMFADSAVFGTVSATGNVTGNYFIGNGSQLTGIISSYGNANVAAYLPTYTGNIGAGNISINDGLNVGNVFTADGVYGTFGAFTGLNGRGIDAIQAGVSGGTFLGTDVIIEITGNSNAYTQFNFQNINDGTQASTDYVITADNGDDETHFLNVGLTNSNWDGTQDNSLGNLLGANDGYFYIQDGNLAIGTKDSTDSYVWKWDNTGNVTATGNLIPSANATYSLGNSTNYWSNIWVASNTIYIGGVALGVTGNTLTVAGEPVLSNDSTSSITTTGNITAGNIEITSNLAVGTGGNVNVLTVKTEAGVISIGNQNDGTFVITDPNFDPSIYVAGPAFYITTNGNADSHQFTFGDSGSANVAFPGNLSLGDGTDTEIINAGNNISITANTASWQFDTAGNLTLPGNTFAVNYANGTAVSLGGDYGDTNVVSLMSAFGSNTVSTTGNITAGNVQATSYRNASGDPILGDYVFANNTIQTDNGDSGITLSIFGPDQADPPALINKAWLFANTGAFYNPGAIEATGNITGANLITGNAGNVILGNSSSRIKQNGSNASIGLQGSIYLIADTGADATNGVVIGGNGYLLANNGSRNAALNYNGTAGTMGIYTVNIYGNAATAITNGGGNGYGNIGANATNRFGTAFLSAVDASGNITGGNILTGGLLSATGNVTGGNLTTAGTVAVDTLTITNNRIDAITQFAIATSNTTSGNSSSILLDRNGSGIGISLEDTGGGPYSWNFGQDNILFPDGSRQYSAYGNANVVANLAALGSNPISTTGNVTGANLITVGSVNVAGNVNLTGAEGSDTARIFADVSGSDTSLVLEVGDDDGDDIVLRHYSFTAGTALDMLTAQRVSNTAANVSVTGNFTATGNITGNTAGYAIGYRDIPQVSFTGNATIATTDAGKHYYSTESTDYILTIANNASQGFQVGAAISIVNQGTGNITIAQGSGVSLYLAGNATSGNRTLSTFGMATIMKVATDTWFINGTGVA